MIIYEFDERNFNNNFNADKSNKLFALTYE